MKKILKLLFALSTATTLPLAVIACQSESLDSILDAIRTGDSKYDISILEGKIRDEGKLDEYSLPKEEAKKLVQNIAEEIIKKSNPEATINWFNHKDSKASNQNYYDVIVKNGKDEDEEIAWTVQQDTQRFTIEVSYFVGTINSENQFHAQQQINRSFAIKCGTSESDTFLQEWIKKFNDNGWNKENPIEIDLTSANITKPEKGKSWSDLDEKIIAEVNKTLDEKLHDFNFEKIRWSIASTNSQITDDLELELKLACNYGDSQDTTDIFYIKFI